MSFMAFLLGGILFVPVYFDALGYRLKESGVFHPLQLFKNFSYIKRGKVFCIFGLLLIILSTTIFLLTGELESFSLGDCLKAGLAVFLVFLVFLYGYYKTALVNSSASLRQSNVILAAILSALKDMAFLFLIVFLVLVVKLIK